MSLIGHVVGGAVVTSASVLGSQLVYQLIRTKAPVKIEVQALISVISCVAYYVFDTLLKRDSTDYEGEFYSLMFSFVILPSICTFVDYMDFQARGPRPLREDTRTGRMEPYSLAENVGFVVFSLIFGVFLRKGLEKGVGIGVR